MQKFLKDIIKIHQINNVPNVRLVVKNVIVLKIVRCVLGLHFYQIKVV